jgi:hypothetical protein
MQRNRTMGAALFLSLLSAPFAGGQVFTRITTGPQVNDGGASRSVNWADVDNDGDIDAFVVNWYNINNMLFLNNGNASFTRVATGAAVTDGGYSETCTWGDYDNDGLIDLYVTNSGSPSLGAKPNFLYHNTGNGTFTRITTGAIVTDARYSRGATWVDYDNDGDGMPAGVHYRVGHNCRSGRMESCPGNLRLRARRCCCHGTCRNHSVTVLRL